ncbi:hypothetical protein MPSI1_002018 [Malassezia psittaci]|uniref:Uncharacterized protein n=1 Tax=Malassezia psittaci TaxID=1821823 RepID=A0AAF0FEU7_9BASI|nr:hypothetical protein MPSI1_002018 [Malassezia psittaci]
MPTLLEVLEQLTVPPIDLEGFLRFTAVHGESDALEFYLDVIEHERHCAIYLAQSHGNESKLEMGAWRSHPSDSKIDPEFDEQLTPMKLETQIAMFDLVMNAQRIDQLYLQSGSAQEILLPDTLKKGIDWLGEAHAMSGNPHELMTLFRLPRE